MNKFLTACERFVKTNIAVRNYSKMLKIVDEIQNAENLRPLRVSVEGNIGAGKTTVINYFAQKPGVEFYPEPIEWWQNLDGHNLLNLLYTDINKWYIVFQKYVLLTRIQIQTSPPKYSTTITQIFERSVQNNRHCFVEQAKSAGYLKEPDFQVFEQWYNWINDNMDIDIDLIVYLRTTPEVVFDRMKNRGRKEETTVPLDYLKELHESHEKWLLNNDKLVKSDGILVIDGNQPLELVLQQCEDNKEKILSKVKIPKKRINSILKYQS